MRMTDFDGAQGSAQTELLVCVKCCKGQSVSNENSRPGQQLFDALLQRSLPDGVHVRAVECLQNCNAGCTIALRGGNRWTYIYGGLDEVTDVDTLIDGAHCYHATSDGLIPWRDRPGHFKRHCVARIPPTDYFDQTRKANR